MGVGTNSARLFTPGKSTASFSYRNQKSTNNRERVSRRDRGLVVISVMQMSVEVDAWDKPPRCFYFV